MTHKSFISLPAFILYSLSEDAVLFFFQDIPKVGEEILRMMQQTEGSFFCLSADAKMLTALYIYFILFLEIKACARWCSNSEFLPQSFNPLLSVFFYAYWANLWFPFFLPLFFFLSPCRNPTCRTVTAKWLASYKTRWAGTVAPPCSSVALPPATTRQRPNLPWCLANGNLLPC